MGDSNHEVHEGLDGIVVARTALSDVDGERGKLVVCGHDIEQLALTATFEDVCALLWRDGVDAEKRDAAGASRGDTAVRAAAAALLPALGAARVRAAEMLPRLGDALAATDGMVALRAGLAHLSSVDDATDGIALTGAAPVLVAAWARQRAGALPVPPDPTLGTAADFLRMVRGDDRPATDAEREALDAYLVTVADHGMNASTFTARVVASTGSDMVSAVVAALGALKGPLHGGAPGPVLDMLDAIGAPDRAEAWLLAELAAGRRIMGMGHRIYGVRDPRAAVLEAAVERLEQRGARTSRLAITRAVERAAATELRRRHPDRPQQANVELYTAVLLDTLALPRAAFTPTFALARTAGWIAHVKEQRTSKRIIRPSSLYIGDRIAPPTP